MSASGRSCRRTAGRAAPEPEPYEIKLAGDGVAIEAHGRQLRLLTGRDADELRRAIAAGDHASAQAVAARKVGRKHH